MSHPNGCRRPHNKIAINIMTVKVQDYNLDTGIGEDQQDSIMVTSSNW